jgi:hypothetical protein
LVIRNLVGKVRKGCAVDTRIRLLLYAVGEDVVGRGVLAFPLTCYAFTILIIDYV